jgi:hypothetical protein
LEGFNHNLELGEAAMASAKAWWVLAQLIWWSLLLHGSKQKSRRRRCRQKLADVLARYSGGDEGQLPPATAAMVSSLWLGASLAARSALRRPLGSKRLKGARIRIQVFGFAGRTAAVSVLAAYLAWRWLAETKVAEPTRSVEG